MGLLDAPLTPRTLTRSQRYTETLRASGLVPVGTRPRAFADTLQRLSDGTETGKMYRTSDALAVDLQSPRLVYVNRYFSSTTFLEAAGPNRIFVRAAVIGPTVSGGLGNGIFRATFGVSDVGVIEPGEQLVTDPIPDLTLLAGQQFWAHTWVYVATLGEKWPVSVPGIDTSLNEGYANTDLTGTNTGWTSSNLSYGYCPASIVGPSTAPTVAAIGDSIANGYADTPNYKGFIARALNGNFGWCSVANDGDAVQRASSPTTTRLRDKVLYGAKYAIVHYGRNDLSNGRTAAQIESDLITRCRMLVTQGITPFVCTVPPRTSSTDNWQTTVNQTKHSSETARVALNQWIRAGMPIDATTKAPVAVGTGGAKVAGDAGHPVKGVFDTCSAVETAQDSGYWKLNAGAASAWYTTDGIHPLAAGYAAMAAIVDTVLFT